MSWEFSTTTVQKARKDYLCCAYEWLENCDISDFDEYEKELINAVKKDGGMICKGMNYIKTVGKYDGEWLIVRSRIDMDCICRNNDVYQD